MSSVKSKPRCRRASNPRYQLDLAVMLRNNESNNPKTKPSDRTFTFDGLARPSFMTRSTVCNRGNGKSCLNARISELAYFQPGSWTKSLILFSFEGWGMLQEVYTTTNESLSRVSRLTSLLNAVTKADFDFEELSRKPSAVSSFLALSFISHLKPAGFGVFFPLSDPRMSWQNHWNVAVCSSTRTLHFFETLG